MQVKCQARLRPQHERLVPFRAENAMFSKLVGSFKRSGNHDLACFC